MGEGAGHSSTVSLTPKQARCYDYLVGYIQAKGFGPSMEEISAALNLGGKSNTFRTLNSLEERGFIRRRRKQARAIEIVDHQSHCCPACGHQFSSSADAPSPSTSAEVPGGVTAPQQSLGDTNSAEVMHDA